MARKESSVKNGDWIITRGQVYDVKPHVDFLGRMTGLVWFRKGADGSNLYERGVIHARGKYDVKTRRNYPPRTFHFYSCEIDSFENEEWVTRDAVMVECVETGAVFFLTPGWYYNQTQVYMDALHYEQTLVKFSIRYYTKRQFNEKLSSNSIKFK